MTQGRSGDQDGPPGIRRRQFLVGGAAIAGAAGAVGALAACSSDDDQAGGAALPPPVYVPFHGRHQTGITSPAPAAGLAAAFKVVNTDRAELRATLQALTVEARRLMEGQPHEEREPAYPPTYTGSLSNPAPPSDLSIIVGVGASLFDDRFGFADAKPTELVTMPFLANDRLVPELSHGDLIINISADTPDVTIFALRQLMRQARSHLILSWMVEGFNRRESAEPGKAPARNLLGFKDGTANLHGDDGAEMDEHVWVAEGDDEPAWAVGGSYLAARTIRMFVEFWDRTPLVEQEALIGRDKQTGAPLGGTEETEEPDYADDPDGDAIPLDAHIRLANPRTPETDGDLILRRGFSFSRGFDNTGQLDQGLFFVSFQRRLQQFLNTQARLDGEPLEEYILPVGGGFFFALPGVEDEDDWYGRSLFEATS